MSAFSAFTHNISTRTYIPFFINNNFRVTRGLSVKFRKIMKVLSDRRYAGNDVSPDHVIAVSRALAT